MGASRTLLDSGPASSRIGAASREEAAQPGELGRVEELPRREAELLEGGDGEADVVEGEVGVRAELGEDLLARRLPAQVYRYMNLYTHMHLHVHMYMLARRLPAKVLEGERRIRDRAELAVLVVVPQQARVVARLAQLEEERDGGLLRERPAVPPPQLPRAAKHLGVAALLGGGHRQQHVLLRLGRQLGEDVPLAPSEHKGGEHAPDAPDLRGRKDRPRDAPLPRGGTRREGLGEHPGEGLWVHKGEEGEQLRDVVLHRRAREEEPLLAPQLGEAVDAGRVGALEGVYRFHG